MKLKKWLEREKISVEEFSAQVGCSVSYIYNVMGKRANMGYDFCRSIEEITREEVTRDELRPLKKKKCPTCGRMGSC